MAIADIMLNIKTKLKFIEYHKIYCKTLLNAIGVGMILCSGL